VLGTYDRELSQSLFQFGVNLILYENISDNAGTNNSTLPMSVPILRSTKGTRLKLDHLLLNRVYQPAERNYARLTGATSSRCTRVEGSGSTSTRHAWAFDLTVDAVKQRDFDGWSGSSITRP